MCKENREGRYFITINKEYEIETVGFTYYTFFNDNGNMSSYPKNLFYTELELRKKKLEKLKLNEGRR